MVAVLPSTKATSGPIGLDGSQELERCINDHISFCIISLAVSHGAVYLKVQVDIKIIVDAQHRVIRMLLGLLPRSMLFIIRGRSNDLILILPSCSLVFSSVRAASKASRFFSGVLALSDLISYCYSSPSSSWELSVGVGSALIRCVSWKLAL